MSDFAQHLDGYVPGKLQELNLPGVAIALIENSKIVTTRNYGFADVSRKIPVTDDTLFQIASISKPIAAWGIMKLVEQGKVSLDAPVDQYLTRWQLPPSEFNNEDVTIRRLLMHFGGTSLSGCNGTSYDEPWYTIEDILNGSLPELDQVQIDYAKRWGMDPARKGEAVEVIHQPDSRFEYSGGGFTMLELVIEEVSGVDFTTFMREEILNPLGMPESTFEIHKEQLAKVAVPYSENLEVLPLYRINGKAAGGMYSTITELAQFACAEMEGSNGEAPGRGVLTAESVAEMHRPDRFAEADMGMDFYTGLGHYIVNMGDIQAVQHTGGNMGWRTVYTIIPEKKLGFVCLINSAGGNDLWMDLIMQWSASALESYGAD